MSLKLPWTSADLAALPDNGHRYEIIDGDLFVSKQPHWHHQAVCNTIQYLLTDWNKVSQSGIVLPAPGLIFTDDNDVVPDVVWISQTRLKAAQDSAGHLRLAPELVVEVLSPGSANELRDREAKRRLYSRRGVQEYWIADWRVGQVDVYRRQGIELQLEGTYLTADILTSPLLPGFSALVADIFSDVQRMQD